MNKDDANGRSCSCCCFLVSFIDSLCVLRWGRCTIYKFFGLCLLLLLLSLVLLQLGCSASDSQVVPPRQDCSQQHGAPAPAPPCPAASLHQEAAEEASWGPHRLALLVPFRERFDELLLFVPFMHQYLRKKKIRHQILVLNQVDRYR